MRTWSFPQARRSGFTCSQAGNRTQLECGGIATSLLLVLVVLSAVVFVLAFALPTMRRSGAGAKANVTKDIRKSDVVVAHPHPTEREPADSEPQQAAPTVKGPPEVEASSNPEAQWAAEMATRKSVSDLAGKWISDVSQIQSPAQRSRALGEMLAALQGGSPVEAEAALAALVGTLQIDFEKQQFHVLAIPYLKSEEGRVRATALRAFTFTGITGEDLAIVTPMVGDPDPQVREALGFAVRKAVGGKFEGEAGATLLRLLRDEDPRVADSALSTVGMHNSSWSEEIEDQLIALCGNREMKQRVIHFALAQAGNKSDEVLAVLLEATSDSDWEVRSSAFSALRFGIPEVARSNVADKLLAIVQSSSDVSTRRECVVPLAFHGEEHHIAALTELANNPMVSESERRYILETLGRTTRRQ